MLHLEKDQSLASSPTPTPQVCEITVNFNKTSTCSKSHGSIIVGSTTVYTWSGGTNTGSVVINATTGQNIQVQGYADAPTSGCQPTGYRYSGLNITINSNGSEIYNDNVLNGNPALYKAFVLTNCNTNINITSSVS